uniref:Uncharacterized protein n=1 Tax=Romanomermis culicivorax TaxID=13658 RepID=A0A915K8V7_ROMCU
MKARACVFAVEFDDISTTNLTMNGDGNDVDLRCCYLTTYVDYTCVGDDANNRMTPTMRQTRIVIYDGGGNGNRKRMLKPKSTYQIANESRNQPNSQNA